MVTALDTVTAAVPAGAIRLAPTLAVSCVALTKVVGRAAPIHSTSAEDAKLDPFTVSVNAAPPAAAEDGERVEIVAPAGKGLPQLVARLYKSSEPNPVVKS